MFAGERLVTVHNAGKEPTGPNVAFTQARRPDNAASGYCIAVISDDNKLIRLAALHGNASPFWSQDDVAAELSTGMRIEYSHRKGLSTGHSEYPHKHDDVWCASVRPLPGSKRRLSTLLPKLAQPTLDACWPQSVRISGERSPRVRARVQVPSLAVLRGSVIRVDELPRGQGAAARATLQVGADVLERVRIVCPEIKDALRQDTILRVPHFLVFGLARANMQHAASCGAEPACEILLISWAPDDSHVVKQASSARRSAKRRKRNGGMAVRARSQAVAARGTLALRTDGIRKRKRGKPKGKRTSQKPS
jgi:hypothetical protein